MLGTLDLKGSEHWVGSLQFSLEDSLDKYIFQNSVTDLQG